jgi:colicin import membrane protein
VAQQETSALFSLKELMRLEDDRVRSEEQLRRIEAEGTERAREHAERALRERENARLRLEENRRHENDRKKGEDAARIEAIGLAEIERARIEAIEKARGDALSIQRAHERKMAALSGSATKKRLRRALVLAATTGVACVIGLAVFYFAGIKPRADQQARALEAMIRTQRAERDQLQRDLDEHNRKVLELEDRMRAEQEATNNVARPSPRSIPRQPSAPRPALKKSPREATPCTCDQHDPLCGCWVSR